MKYKLIQKVISWQLIDYLQFIYTDYSINSETLTLSKLPSSKRESNMEVNQLDLISSLTQHSPLPTKDIEI